MSLESVSPQPAGASRRSALPNPLQRFRVSEELGATVAGAPPRAAETGIPGPLRSESWITLQTAQAQRLVRGRREAEGVTRIVGLAGFGSRLRSMWNAARADDPWADWWLVRVHEVLEESNLEIQALLSHVDGLLARIPGVSVVTGQSVHPMRVPLAFSNPYGYRGAYLLAKFDALARAVLTAEHVALIGRDESRLLIRDGGRQVRRAFLAAEGYQSRGATRDDVRLGAARAEDARRRMGDVPAEILEGRLRAQFAPASATALRTETAVTESPPA